MRIFSLERQLGLARRTKFKSEIILQLLSKSKPLVRFCLDTECSFILRHAVRSLMACPMLSIPWVCSLESLFEHPVAPCMLLAFLLKGTRLGRELNLVVKPEYSQAAHLGASGEEPLPPPRQPLRRVIFQKDRSWWNQNTSHVYHCTCWRKRETETAKQTL